MTHQVWRASSDSTVPFGVAGDVCGTVVAANVAVVGSVAIGERQVSCSPKS